MKSVVIIPTYNEAPNIQKLIEEIFQLYPEMAVLVVDDNSPDRTDEIVEKLQFKYPLLHLLKRKKKNGIARAYLQGFQWALEKDFFSVIQMDADFSHRPKDIARLMEATQDSQMIIGSRYIDGGVVEGWPLKRLTLSRTASAYARMMTGLSIKDMTAGFCLIESSALKKLDFKKIRSNGYAFQIELKYRLEKSGANLLEIPITFTERQAGESKMDKEIILEAIWNVFKLKFN